MNAKNRSEKKSIWNFPAVKVPKGNTQMENEMLNVTKHEAEK